MKNILTCLVTVIALSACEKEKTECPGSIEQTFNVVGFKRINAAETFNVTVKKAPDFTIKARGCASDIADLNINLTAGEFVNIAFKTYRKDRHRIDFEITMPELRSFNLSGAATGTVTGFAGQPTYMRTILSGTANCTVTGTPGYVDANVSGAAQLTINGNTDEFYAYVAGDGRLHAYELKAKEAEVAVEGTGRIYVFAINKLSALATGTGYIYYKGNPAVKDIETEGLGKVIPQ